MSLPDNTRYRPLRPGAQIVVAATLEHNAGTICCFVQPVLRWGNKDAPTWKVIGPPCLLTCYHVLKSPKYSGPWDNHVHQPDAVGFENVIGDYYVGDLSGKIDAALVKLGDRALDKGLPTNEVLGGIGRVTLVVDPPPRGAVRKYGRTTGLTQGLLPPEGATGWRRSCTPDGGQTIDDCFEILSGQSLFGDEGDSGAAIIDQNGNLVGILCHQGRRASPQYPFAVACRATNVFNRLAALVLEKEKANYPESAYPNGAIELQLIP
jgi:hypothetical protein